MFEKQLPKTAEYLNHMEEIFSEFVSDYEKFEQATDEEKAIYMNPMLHFAETIYMENSAWAEDIAKYLCVLCDIKKINVKINVE